MNEIREVIPIQDEESIQEAIYNIVVKAIEQRKNTT